MLQKVLTKVIMLATDREAHQRAFGALVVFLGLATLLSPGTALALPWETPIQQVAASLCGPVAKAFGVVAFVSAGIMIALGEVKGWIHNMAIVLIGVSIAVLAPSFLSMFNVSAGFSCN